MTEDEWRTLLGLTMEQVEKQLGQPDGKGNTSRKYPWPNIYLYGSVEVVFNRKTRRVCHIFDDPDKGGTTGLDLWRDWR